MRLLLGHVLLLLPLLVVASTSFSDDSKRMVAAKRGVDFEHDVRPILSRRCFECHGADTQESGLRLDDRASLLKGGKSGRPAVVPRKSAESRLIQVVSGRDPKVTMPPEGARLSASEIETLRRWIDDGLPQRIGGPEAASTADKTPARGAASPRADFWSFQPVHPRKPPQVQSDALPANPIDAFVFDNLRAAHLAPSPRADRRTLIRRLYLDVVGLPPTPVEIAAFLSDNDPLAWPRLVDRVLASPHFGERWARHWLDVVRFAETDGFETNIERPNAYRYRDYVIDSLNADRPYDRFVVDQIAGDTVGGETVGADTGGQDAATGFLVGGPSDKVKSPDIVLTRMQRQDELSDMINTTGTAFLGLTLGCAKCHDHKFDPIPQRDFYAVQAVFAGVRHGDRAVRDSGERERVRRRTETDARLASAVRELTKLGIRAAPDPRGNIEDFSPLEARAVRFTIHATGDGLEPCLDELEVFDLSSGATPENVALASAGGRAEASSVYADATFHKLAHVNDGLYGNEHSWISGEPGRGWVSVDFARPRRIGRVSWARDRNGNYRDRLASDYVIEAQSPDGRWVRIGGAGPHGGTTDRNVGAGQAPRIAALMETFERLKRRRAELAAGSMAYAGLFEEPAPVHRLFRGDPMAPKETVPPGGVSVLGVLKVAADAPERERRRALAEWIARPENPLTSRVIVNRIWHYHFGRGIVDTPSDFGRNGGRPTHPELLDWLAGELPRRGWSLKQIHRLVLTSATYCQSSAPRPDGLRADADARLLWRFPPRRLEAEAIRDCMLATSGSLVRKVGGPGFSVFKPNNNYVRVYTPKEEFGSPEWRRMVYVSKVRMEQDAVFGAFDCPDAGLIAPRRTQSTTALQALNLMNSRFTLDQAERMALATQRDAGPQIDRQVAVAFQRAFGRDPDPVERSAGGRLVERHGLALLCRTLFNANEFLFLP